MCSASHQGLTAHGLGERFDRHPEAEWRAGRARRATECSQADSSKAAIEITLRAGEIPDWGYRRIQGELGRLGHELAASTVWKIRRTARIDTVISMVAGVGFQDS